VNFSYDYPIEFGESGYPCDSEQHSTSNMGIFTVGLTSGGWCTISVADEYGTTANRWCSGIKSGQVGIVYTDADYQGQTELDAVTGIVL